jgi:hypothetical protein
VLAPKQAALRWYFRRDTLHELGPLPDESGPAATATMARWTTNLTPEPTAPVRPRTDRRDAGGR